MKLNKIAKVVAFIEIVLGILLLLSEINDYIRLLSTHEADEFMGGLVDFHKYEEDCYSYFYLYSLFILSGFSFWINKKLHWGLTQLLVITYLFTTIMALLFMSRFVLWFGIFLCIFPLAAFIYIEFKMYYSSTILNAMKVSKSVQWLSAIGGIISCVVWWALWERVIPW